MSSRDPLSTRISDWAAKRLWSGEVHDGPTDGGVSDTAGQTYRRSGWNPEQVSVAKAAESGLRRGRVPEHIESPIKGKPRSANPLGLRKLAKSGSVQSNIGAILGDLEDIPWSVVPIDESTDVPDGEIEDAEANLRDINPNPETFDDVCSMLARDLLEVGNCVAVQSFLIDGRRVEVLPYDPSAFTADWDSNRVLSGFYQYPNAGQRWGDPVSFDRDEVIWGTLNPTTARAGFYGLSPVEVVERFINIMGGLVDKEVKELEEGMPSGLISLVGDEWSQQNYDNFETYWDSEVKGEQIKHPIAEGDAKFEAFNMTYKELQVLDRQRWYSKLVAAAFRVPVSETGLAIGQEMTRATDVSQRQKYKKRALGSLLGQLEDLWTYQHLHRWFSEDIRLRFDPGRDLMEKQELSKINDRRLKNGTRTINEVREEQGLTTVEWGDEPLVKPGSQGGGDPGGPGGGGFGPDPGGDGGGGGLLDDAGANQQALGEGLQQNQTPTNDGGALGGSGEDFSDGGDGGAAVANAWTADKGTWLPEGRDVITAKALRSTDNYRQFSFQPDEIESLQSDVEGVYHDAIESVLNQIKGNQQLLRKSLDRNSGGGHDSAEPEAAVEKNLPEFMRLIRQEIGLSFAEDTAEVLTTHKSEKVTEGEDAILSELASVGVDPEDVDLTQTRQRVVERLRKRSLKVTKPISKRLEGDLRDVLQEGWQQGQGITEIEDAIEGVTDKWTGHEAERLARDQLGRASKEGRMSYAKDTADKVGGWHQSWIATGDARTRESHDDMDGETVPLDEPFVVDYVPDGGPAQVREDYPGDSVYGIQCRCDYELVPAPVMANVRKWARDPTARMREVASGQGKSVDQVLIAALRGPESKTAAAKRLGVSKPTLYKWGRAAGLVT